MFPLRPKISKDDKQVRALGNSSRLQSFRCNSVNEHKPDNKANGKFSSNLSTPDQPERLRLERDLKLKKLLGKPKMFLQFSKDNSES